MKLQVKTIEGKLFDLSVNSDDSVTTLKEQISPLINLSTEELKLITRGTQILQNKSRIKDYNLKDGDILALLKIRNPPLVKEESQELTESPTKQMIIDITAKFYGVSPSDVKLAPPPKPRTAQPTSISAFRNQLQDLVGNLIPRLSEQNEDEEEDAENDGESEQNEPPLDPNAPPPEIPVDDTSLQQLKDMGFTEERSKKALILNNMNPQAAMEWILEHEDDADFDDPISNAQLHRISRANQAFVPDPAAVQKLKDMGFSEQDIATALKATNNNSEAACAWLLGERDVEPTMDEASLGILNSVLTNPIVQSGLSNPRVVQALQVLMEDPSNATQYLNDPEIGPVLLQVHNIMTRGGGGGR